MLTISRMTGQVVYLLRHATEPRFKIGISANPWIRGGELRDEIDFQRSYYIVPERGGANKIESALHLMFSHQRVERNAGHNGYTEWFSMDCFESVRRFIEGNATQMGCSLPIEMGRFCEQKGVAVQEKLKTPGVAHLSVQAKGHIGKTLVAGIIAGYFEQYGAERVVRWDGDPLSRAWSSQAKARLSWQPDQYGNFDLPSTEIWFNECATDGKQHVVDCGTAVFLPFLSYLREMEFPRLCTETGLRCVLHVILGGGEMMKATWRGLEAIRSVYNDIVIWRNLNWGEPPAVLQNFPTILLPKIPEWEISPGTDLVPYQPAPVVQSVIYPALAKWSKDRGWR